MLFYTMIPRIRLSDFDLGGVLYHANYFQLYEAAREDFLCERNVPYSNLANNSQHLAVIESTQKFLKPVLYGQAILVSLEIIELKKASLTFSYKLFNSDNSLAQTTNTHKHQNPDSCGECIHYASTKHVFVKKIAGEFKVSSFPPELYQALESGTKK